MRAEDFIRDYEKALATQNWENISPLVAEKAVVTFSNGEIHEGKAKIKTAFEKNFSIIKNEKYEMFNVSWLLRTDKTAVYVFEFKWAGLINTTPAEGAGRGTSVLIKEQEKWKLLTEHLVSKPKN